jgi:hypothetical protein
MQKKLKQGYYNYKDINQEKLIKILPERGDKKEQKRQVILACKEIQNCLTNYCRSDSTSLLQFAENYFKNIFSTPTYVIESDDLKVEQKGIFLTEEQQKELAQFTREHWLNLIDTDKDTSITHDTYLKLFHLRDYKINRFFCKQSKEYINIDVVALDEAQDSNPVTLSIFNKITKQKIVVGDRYQQLYAWRGATNAMTYFPNYTKAYLTESFRFNSNIADIAMNVLAYAGNKLKLKGSGHVAETKSKAILCRTNAEIIELLNYYADTSTKVFLMTDLKPIFSQLYHIEAVFFNKVPKFPNKLLADITNKEQLIEATHINDDINNLCKLANNIRKQHGSLYSGIQKLQSCITNSQEEADIVISTIHKSKGLEWDNVVIAEKLIVPANYDEGITKNDVDNWLYNYENQCLLYVAVTRAKHSITVPDYLHPYLY